MHYGDFHRSLFAMDFTRCCLWLQILEVNNHDFQNMSHNRALEILRGTTHLAITVKSNLLGKPQSLLVSALCHKQFTGQRSLAIHTAFGGIKTTVAIRFHSRFHQLCVFFRDHWQSECNAFFKLPHWISICSYIWCGVECTWYIRCYILLLLSVCRLAG